MNATEACNDVVKGLKRAAKEAEATGDARGACVLIFDKGHFVKQLVLGKLSLFEAIGAVDVLKGDLRNQADQLKQGELSIE